MLTVWPHPTPKKQCSKHQVNKRDEGSLIRDPRQAALNVAEGSGTLWIIAATGALLVAMLVSFAFALKYACQFYKLHTDMRLSCTQSRRPIRLENAENNDTQIFIEERRALHCLMHPPLTIDDGRTPGGVHSAPSPEKSGTESYHTNVDSNLCISAVNSLTLSSDECKSKEGEENLSGSSSSEFKIPVYKWNSFHAHYSSYHQEKKENLKKNKRNYTAKTPRDRSNYPAGRDLPGRFNHFDRHNPLACGDQVVDPTNKETNPLLSKPGLVNYDAEDEFTCESEFG